jgi:hypothetical protein
MANPLRLSPRIFTLEEANALVPDLEARLMRLARVHADLETVREELEVLRLVASSGGDEENPDRRALDEAEARIRSLAGELTRLQRRILALGCVPKSFQEGLIDFFSLGEGRLVFLCWRLGEHRIEYWHTLEGGFQGRRPISTFPGTGAADATDAAGDPESETD